MFFFCTCRASTSAGWLHGGYVTVSLIFKLGHESARCTLTLLQIAISKTGWRHSTPAPISRTCTRARAIALKGSVLDLIACNKSEQRGQWTVLGNLMDKLLALVRPSNKHGSTQPLLRVPPLWNGTEGFCACPFVSTPQQTGPRRISIKIRPGNIQAT